MSQLTTGCPNCAIKFRLTPEQLAAAGGMVRCGKCMTVFNANDHKIASQQESREQPEDTAKLPVMTELLHSEFGQQQALTEDQKPSRICAKLVVILIGAILLAAQYSYFFSRELSQTESYREPLIEFCNYSGCTVELFRDIDKLAVKQLLVQSHPSQPGALAVDLIIENHGLFDQPYPKITLQFSDMENQLVAERMFLASEYLQDDTGSLGAEASLIPNGNQRRVNFSLVDPGATAINYSVELKE
jgi:predicted Zn finger-like uncharacterized protein|tara:strand:+ start:518 stop:1252 length:735 start_codon:yes stop_codon:yes gene_type:complete